MRVDDDDLVFQTTSSPSDIIQMLKTRVQEVRQECQDSAVIENEQEDVCAVNEARIQVCMSTDSIRFDSHMRCFLVRGSGDVVHIVKLGNKPTCSCRPVGLCYHITAVQLATGIKEKHQKPVKNLTLLRRNKREVKQKAGRKRARPGDYDVIAAPDSQQNVLSSLTKNENDFNQSAEKNENNSVLPEILNNSPEIIQSNNETGDSRRLITLQSLVLSVDQTKSKRRRSEENTSDI